MYFSFKQCKARLTCYSASINDDGEFKTVSGKRRMGLEEALMRVNEKAKNCYKLQLSTLAIKFTTVIIIINASF